MVDDHKIWACALAVERDHRDEAPRHVAERIGTLALAGDTAGVETWKRIATALDQLRDGRGGKKPS